MKSRNLIYLCLILCAFIDNINAKEKELDNSLQAQSMLSVLYAQSSAEYEASNIQTYVDAKSALDKALNENLIFGAGIDVFKKEPPDDNNPLLKNEKVYLSPHTAAFTDECMTRMGKETIQNIIDFFEEKLEKSKIVKL